MVHVVPETKLIPTHETAPMFLYNPIKLTTYSFTWETFADIVTHSQCVTNIEVAKVRLGIPGQSSECSMIVHSQ